MNKVIMILLCVAMAFCGCEGEQGPIGPPGRDADITVLNGVLLAGDILDGDLIGSPIDFWEIDTSVNLEYAILTVHVRPGEDYTWFEPLWEFAESYVNIYLDESITAGYEFRISIAY